MERKNNPKNTVIKITIEKPRSKEEILEEFTTDKNEQWLPIPKHEDYYISNTGKVVSFKRKKTNINAQRPLL